MVGGGLLEAGLDVPSNNQASASSASVAPSMVGGGLLEAWPPSASTASKPPSMVGRSPFETILRYKLAFVINIYQVANHRDQPLRRDDDAAA